jgi:hypothetical protein
MTPQPAPISLHIELTQNEANQLAQFLKRMGLSDYRAKAQTDSDAYTMQDAAERLRASLADAGYDPR